MEHAGELISVIVPVYNVQAYLAECVESILVQTYQDLEIILVDDGSTDGSGALCDGLALGDPRVRVIHKENGGLSDARNAGLELATGQWLSFVDGDDLLAPETLERLHSAAVGFGCPMAVCNILRLYEDGKTECFYRPAEAVRILDGNERFETLKQPSVCNKLFCKELFDGVRFPMGKYYEDTFVYHIPAYRAGRIALTGHDGYLYRSRRDSILGGGIYTNRYFDYVQAIYERMYYLTDRIIPEYMDEVCLSLYAAVANAEKHIQKTRENRDSFRRIRGWYREAYGKLMARRSVCLKQKIRLVLLRHVPKLHGLLY